MFKGTGFVIADSETSSKLNKAKDLGVQVLAEQEWLDVTNVLRRTSKTISFCGLIPLNNSTKKYVKALYEIANEQSLYGEY